jgi:two-component system sensor histidine kinase DegS
MPTEGGAAQQAQTTALMGEAQAAVASSANVLRDVRERYRTAHTEDLERWSHNGHERERDEALATAAVGEERANLSRLDLALQGLESAWLLLAPSDQTLVLDASGPASSADVQMRILEAQEAERSRLAREVHDGPAQAISNAIFQVEVVERLLDRDERLARQELRALREMLTRELRGVRAYLSQLRPPLLADLGLAGAIREAAEQIGSVLSIKVSVQVDEAIDRLPEAIEVVILRVVQEALQNVRKHARPTNVRVRAVRESTSWTIEVRDDGVGFDSDRVADTGRRSYGLHFMRERAELIGARFEVRSRPDLGTVVRLVIPWQEES